MLFSFLSLFIGIGSVFLIKGTRDFKGLLLFQLGSLIMILLTYITTQDHELYKIGLNYNFVLFVQILLSILISILWLNSATELYSHQLANRETLVIYTTLALTLCMYYSFANYNAGYGNVLQPLFILIGIFFLFLSGLVCLARYKNVGYLLLCIALFMLFGKLVVSTFFYQYNWLNLNIFNWLWIYVFAVAVVFIRFGVYREQLEQSWNSIDKLNLQVMNLIDTSPFPIMIARTGEHKLLTINNKASTLFGITRKEAGYHTLDDVLVDEQNREKFYAHLKQYDSVSDFDVMVCNIVSATPFWMSASAKLIEYNNVEAVYFTVQDIVLRKEREVNLQNQANKDPLTMAWNRHYFEKFTPNRANECVQNAQNFSLLLLDVDKFRKVNERYGHKIGDKVLIEIAEICRSSLRDDDIVARFGGEEFIIFLNDTDSRSAMRVAERLRQSVETAEIKGDDGDLIDVTVSIGVVSSEKTASIEVLIRQVEEAMAMAKHNGRNRVELYDAAMVESYQKKKTKSQAKAKSTAKRDVHPIFQHEDTEEISLLDDYDNKLI